MQEKYPKVEMRFEKSTVIGWFWYCKVWGSVTSQEGWAPTYRMAKGRASRFARKTLDHPRPITLFFDEDGNPMDFKYSYGRKQ